MKNLKPNEHEQVSEVFNFQVWVESDVIYFLTPLVMFD